MSGQSRDREVDLSAVNGEATGETGVEHGGELVRFVEAVLGTDEAELASARRALRAVLRPEAFVDACAVIGAFSVVDRIADATGIPLDGEMRELSAEVRAQLDLARFASSANTPRGSH